MKNSKELKELCNSIKELVEEGDFDKCREIICDAMREFPDKPEPHNLLGIILEKTGDHSSAMRHFRAAWALDPTYLPANQNLKTYGTFYSYGSCAYDESECTDEDRESNTEIRYDDNGLKHIVVRSERQ